MSSMSGLTAVVLRVETGKSLHHIVLHTSAVLKLRVQTQVLHGFTHIYSSMLSNQ